MGIVTGGEQGARLQALLEQALPAETGNPRHHRLSCRPRRLPLQQHHKTQGRVGSQGATQTTACQDELVEQGRRLHHQPHGARVAQDVEELVHRGTGPPHRIGGASAHQALVGHQPAGAVFRKQGHHIAWLHPKLGKAQGRLADLLVQLAKAQDFGRLGVGGLQGRGIAIALGQGRPELLQAAEVAPFGALP